MVRPTLRSGKRKYRKTVSGKITIYRPDKKTRPPKCSNCDNILPGVAKGIRSEVRKLTKSQRTPNRPFGGNMCSPCTKRKIIEKTRVTH